jgi:8-oxo-dGTP diphosphatase
MSQEKPILVAAGILQRGNSILICQRHRSDAYGLQWEFPGGKVEPGEDLAEALQRELAEELGIQVAVGPEVFRLQHQYPDRYVEVAFFSITEFTGDARNLVFESIEWAPRAELHTYNFLAADRDLVIRISKGELV